MAAIEPGVDGEWLARHEHRPRTNDGAPGLVGDLGRDLVALVAIGMSQLRQGGVDLDGERAIGTDRHLGLGDDFGRCLRATPPPRRGAKNAPPRPAGIPRVIRREPPVSWSEQPVPARHGIPSLVRSGAGDLVLHPGLRDGRAEVVFCLDRRWHLLAQHHGLGGSLDVHLELGLLVLLDPERSAAHARDGDLVNAKGRIRRQLDRAVEAAEGVGLEVPGQDLLTLGILDLDGEGLAGEVRGVGLIVAGVGHPELEPDGLAGPIDRTVGDRDHLDLIVGRVVVLGSPDLSEAEMRQAALGGSRGAKPLEDALVVGRSHPSEPRPGLPGRTEVQGPSSPCGTRSCHRPGPFASRRGSHRPLALAARSGNRR